jgi:hypothetical protein
MSTLETDVQAMVEALDEIILMAAEDDLIVSLAFALDPFLAIHDALLAVMIEYDDCPSCNKRPACPLYKLWMSLPVHQRDQIRAAYLEDVANSSKREH